MRMKKETKGKGIGTAVKRLAALLCMTAVMICVLEPEGKAGAASAGLGALSKLENVTEKQMKKMSKMLGDIDVDAEYMKQYEKTKWNKNFTKEDLRYMACIINCEARDMGFDAKAAVGNVVLNRMYDTDEWKHVSTVHDVIYDRGPNNKWGTQFSPTKDGSMKKALALYDSMDPSKYKASQIAAMEECIEVAKAVFRGYKSVPDDYMYFNAYINSQSEKCLKNGWPFTIMEKHIYYGK